MKVACRLDASPMPVKRFVRARPEIIRIGFAACIAPLLLASIAPGQAYFYLWDNGGGNFNWGTGTNWGLNPPLNLGVNNFTPGAWFEEMGLINNGNVVNVTTPQTQFSSSAANNVVAAAGVTVDGITATGNGSTLNVASGGTLSLLVTYGPSGTPPDGTPTAGTGNATLNNRGVLTVQPGGTLNAGADVIINSGTFTVGGAGPADRFRPAIFARPALIAQSTCWEVRT